MHYIHAINVDSNASICMNSSQIQTNTKANEELLVRKCLVSQKCLQVVHLELEFSGRNQHQPLKSSAIYTV